MRKVILYMQISIDGVVSDPERWMTLSDDIIEDTIEYYRTLDTVVFGSHTYPSLAEYWQNAEKFALSMVEKKFAEIINSINKIVISRTPLALTWRNSQQLIFRDNDDFIIKIQDLKNNPGKNISVESGIHTWKLFLQNSLFDEMHLFVHPVIAGSGQKLFSEIEAKRILQLKNARIYHNGVMALQYERKSEQT